MLQSMTGYGKAVAVINHKKFTVELKSLNSKQFDLNIKMPSLFREKELETRNLLAEQIGRGKAELAIYYESGETEQKTSLNSELIKAYAADLTPLSEELGLYDKSALLQCLLRMPEVMKTERPELDPKEWEEIVVLIKAATDQFSLFRQSEGKKLEEDILQRVKRILELLDEVKLLAPERVNTAKERIKQHLDDTVVREQIDENRFEQELIYYLEKYDITEEIIRLTGHADYFFETCENGVQQGKKLGFITQEMGREINTIGSKANHAGIQKAVVQMKDELEKVKEQMLNIL